MFKLRKNHLDKYTETKFCHGLKQLTLANVLRKILTYHTSKKTVYSRISMRYKNETYPHVIVATKHHLSILELAIT